MKAGTVRVEVLSVTAMRKVALGRKRLALGKNQMTAVTERQVERVRFSD